MMFKKGQWVTNKNEESGRVAEDQTGEFVEVNWFRNAAVNWGRNEKSIDLELLSIEDILEKIYLDVADLKDEIDKKASKEEFVSQVDDINNRLNNLF